MYLTLWLRPLSIVIIHSKKNRQGLVPGGSVSGLVYRIYQPTPAARAFGNAKYQKKPKADIMVLDIGVTYSA